MIRGKSYKATTVDIAEGFTTVNPIFLKPLSDEAIKSLYTELLKTITAVRGERFPTSDIPKLRMRNLKLQRLHSTSMVIRTYAKFRRIQIL